MKDAKKFIDSLDKALQELMPSGKHMVGRDLGRLEPTSSLIYQAKG